MQVYGFCVCIGYCIYGNDELYVVVVVIISVVLGVFGVGSNEVGNIYIVISNEDCFICILLYLYVRYLCVVVYIVQDESLVFGIFNMQVLYKIVVGVFVLFFNLEVVLVVCFWVCIGVQYVFVGYYYWSISGVVDVGCIKDCYVYIYIGLQIDGYICFNLESGVFFKGDVYVWCRLCQVVRMAFGEFYSCVSWNDIICWEIYIKNRGVVNIDGIVQIDVYVESCWSRFQVLGVYINEFVFY